MNRNVTAVILVILAIGVYLEFTSKFWLAAQEVRTVNETYITAIDNAAKLIEKRDQILQEYNALSAIDQDRLNKILPTSVDNIRLIVDLNSVALRRGLTVKGIKATAPDAKTAQSTQISQPVGAITSGVGAVSSPLSQFALDTVTVSFDTDATYQQFVQFLRDLEANLHILDVSKLKVVAHDNGINEYSVELKTYWLRQQ
ncbi:MAG: hypothetical protein WCV79_02440 [Candidatus Paceibacterota bacterium]